MHFVSGRELLCQKDNGIVLQWMFSRMHLLRQPEQVLSVYTYILKILSKENAPEVVRKTLRSKRQKCIVGTGILPILIFIWRSALFCWPGGVWNWWSTGTNLVLVQTKSMPDFRDFDLLTSIDQKKAKSHHADHTHPYDGMCKNAESQMFPPPNASTSDEM